VLVALSITRITHAVSALTRALSPSSLHMHIKIHRQVSSIHKYAGKGGHMHICVFVGEGSTFDYTIWAAAFILLVFRRLRPGAGS
jgi:hypothetical protein